MDKLNGLARAGGLDAPGRATLQVHYRPTYHVNTIDASGVRGMLKKHGGEFSRHLNDEVRKSTDKPDRGLETNGGEQGGVLLRRPTGET